MGRRDLAAVASLCMAVENPELPPTLAIEGVSHRYGARAALIDVTFSVAPSRFTVLLGLNGAGKSTLFSLITRLYAIQRGHIRIFGHDVVRTSSEALRAVGVVFQPRTLDLDLSVVQNLIYHAALHGIGKRQARARANELLESIALSQRAHDKVRNLSGGQMRQVEIARALLHRPRLLLLDEPTVGLDIKSRAAILGHVHKMVGEGVSVLWATHLIDEVAQDETYWRAIQEAYAPDRTLINLNNGHHSPAPRVVHDALKHYLDSENQLPVYYASLINRNIERVRRALAAEFGCDAEELAITRNASESLQMKACLPEPLYQRHRWQKRQVPALADAPAVENLGLRLRQGESVNR